MTKSTAGRVPRERGCRKLVRMTSMALVVMGLSACVSLSQPGQPATDGEIHSKVSIESQLSADVLFNILLAEVAAQRGEAEYSLERYIELADETKDEGIFQRTSEIATRLERFDDEILDVARLWVDVASNSVDARLFLASVYLHHKQETQAIEQLAVVVRESESFGAVIRVLARYAGRGRSLEMMRQLVEVNPDHMGGYLAYARLAIREGKFQSALESIDHVLDVEEGHHDAMMLKVRVLQMKKETVKAMALLGEAIKRYPRDINFRKTYASILTANEQTELALVQFQAAYDIDENDTEVLFALGLLSRQQGLLDDAERYLSRLNDLGHNVDDTGFYLGEIAETRNDYESAISWYNLVRRGENFLNAKLRRARLLSLNGRLEEAREDLSMLRASQRRQAWRIYMAEGEILRELGHHDDAFAVYNRALDEDANNTQLLYARAMLAERLNRLDVLENDLMRILEQDNENVDALNALGYTLADKTERYEEALQYIRRALDLRPNSHYILDSMGWVMYRLKRYEQAEKYLRKALSISSDTEIAAHLGEVLWAKGDREAAIEVWESALDKDGGSDVVRKVMKRFGL